MDPEKKSLNFIFLAKYVIPKSLKFSNWMSQTNDTPFLGWHSFVFPGPSYGSHHLMAATSIIQAFSGLSDAFVSGSPCSRFRLTHTPMYGAFTYIFYTP